MKERVESWMTDVLIEMRATNRYISKKAIFDYGKERERPRYETRLSGIISSGIDERVNYGAQSLLNGCLRKFSRIFVFHRPDWIMLYQGMVCLAANQVWWTAEVEEVFFKVKKGNKRAMKEYLEAQNRQLDDLVVKGENF